MNSKIDALCYNFNVYLRNLKDGFVKSLNLHINNKISILSSQIDKLSLHRQDLELMRNDIEDNRINIESVSSYHLNSPKLTRVLEKFRDANRSIADVR